MEADAHHSRVAIIGAGHVGVAFAYALLLSGLAMEIVLVDANRERAEGEAMDLLHAAPFARPTRISAGDLEDCAGAGVVVLTAGAAQRPGETRLDLARRNAELFRQLVPALAAVAPDAALVVATNPVDVLTMGALALSGFPPERVIGSGTVLDTGRFRALLGEHYQVDPRSIHAYILGEHGDSEVAAWSLANVAGLPLRDFCRQRGMTCGPEEMDEIVRQVRGAAYEIIQRKGYTSLAIGAGLVRIVEAILRDQRSVLTVSSRIDGPYGLRGVCLSLPCVVDRSGIRQVLELPLATDEVEALRRSASIIQQAAAELGW